VAATDDAPYSAMQLLVPSRRHLRRAYGDFLAGTIPRDPAVLAMTFSAIDASIAPAGRHNTTLWAQWHPYELAGGRSWDDARAEVGETILRQVESVAPGFTASVEHVHVQTPLDLERELGLLRGNVMHVEMGLERDVRDPPAARALGLPDAGGGLYLTGASTHPGGVSSGPRAAVPPGSCWPTGAGGREGRGRVTRAYVPPRQRPRDVGRAGLLPWLLAVRRIGCEIAYPLVPEGRRAGLTVATVVVFGAASLSHALVHRGVAWAAGYPGHRGRRRARGEAIGVATGWPFGSYDYTGSLGREVIGVPLVIPLAWAMFAYPALLVGRRLGRGWTAWPLGALALASWDLFLDPQMVGEGHWRFADPTPALPACPACRCRTTWVGVVALLLVGLLTSCCPTGMRTTACRRPCSCGRTPRRCWPTRVLRPARVALVGGVVMGLVAVPYAVSLWRDRP
jgi:hypothetical protein